MFYCQDKQCHFFHRAEAQPDWEHWWRQGVRAQDWGWSDLKCQPFMRKQEASSQLLTDCKAEEKKKIKVGHAINAFTYLSPQLNKAKKIIKCGQLKKNVVSYFHPVQTYILIRRPHPCLVTSHCNMTFHEGHQTYKGKNRHLAHSLAHGAGEHMM